MRISVAVLAIALIFPCAAPARDIHYGAVDHPELLSCDSMHWRGQLDDADLCYRRLLNADVPTAIRAEAAWALKDFQLANRLFRDAAAVSPDDASIRVRWGDLFADTHQDSEAMNLYREAMQLDETNGFAYVGAAKVLAGGFDDAANSFLEPVLSSEAMDAGARLSAWLLLSRVSLESSNYSQAAEAMDKAEALQVAGDWPPLELYALRAANDLLHNVTDSRFTPLSLEYNPHFGGIYAIPAHFYVITRRYREAIDLYQKAVDIEPALASAHEELGINLLRDNQFSRARSHLETAYDVDPFSPAAVNTLRLLDSFDDFDVINDPELPERGVIPIIMRLHEEESAAIAPYAIRLTRDSIREFTERYGFELREPVVVEMYPDHEDFAVRTAGMPGIGILGATFGYVVAMDSPSSRPTSQFQWGTTLWHEMAHVFTLEATGHLVPRWFSEGVSVFEEWQSGPNAGVRIPMAVYNAMKDDRFLPIAELDEGFIRPTYEEQVIVSYMQAGLVCHFIDQQFGAEKLRQLLNAFGDGQLTAEAISTVFDMPPVDFDDEFNRYIDEEHGDFLDNMENWHRTHQSIGELAAEEDWESIVSLAEHLIDLLPGYVEPDSPYVALARSHDALDNRDAAIAGLEAFWKRGGYDPEVLRRLSGWLDESGRTPAAIDVLQTVNMVDPLDLELHGALGDLLMAEGRAAEALLEYSVALALNPHDKATAYYRLARAHNALGDREASQDQLLLALDVAPNFRPAQRLLLDLMR
ncbi:MAG: tetratricopeptide repeat protein, partial [Gammaproteobacteria bacterium]|nr:tetratricopeptide repeat protein [Gammaproteobacteria bacterium]